MKIIKTLHADGWMTVYLTACPSCDLPLEVLVSTRKDDRVTWHYGERTIDECPGCGETLPEPVPPEAVAA